MGIRERPLTLQDFSDSDTARRSAFYSAATLKGKPIPPRDWLVPGRVPKNTVTLLSGDGGTGKSLLALQLGVAVVTGASWLGREVQQGNVLMISAEDDDDELHRRLADILAFTGDDFDKLGGLTLRSLAGENALLAVEMKPVLEMEPALTQTELFAELETRAMDERPSLIIIDTLADVYPANENDRAKVRQFVGLLRGLAIRQKCAVMLLGHPSLNGLNSGTGTSGSTAWNNSVRSRLYLKRIIEDGYEPDSDKRVLSIMKQNYGTTGSKIGMTWQNGVLVPDAVETNLDRRATNAKAERVFLKLLEELTSQGRLVSPHPSSTYAPTLFAKHPKAEGMTKHALASAMEHLFDRGEIVVKTHGAGAKARSHIACVTGERT